LTLRGRTRRLLDHHVHVGTQGHTAINDAIWRVVRMADDEPCSRGTNTERRDLCAIVADRVTRGRRLVARHREGDVSRAECFERRRAEERRLERWISEYRRVRMRRHVEFRDGRREVHRGAAPAKASRLALKEV